jgi:indolepyruvate ferredoxin oxidoreductase alpha subunit
VMKSPNSHGRGIITSGLTWLSVLDVLEKAKYRPNLLKLGVTNPLEKEVLLSFLTANDQVLILEELDDILENQIKAMAYDNRLTTKIIGKTCDEDFIGEFTPDKTLEKILTTWPGMMPAGIKEVIKGKEKFPLVKVPERPAQMCPGCGHRSAFFAIKKALGEKDVTVADIGCHTLGYMPPYEVGEVLMCMGASPGMGSGLSLFNDSRKVVAFIGDSTFFHAGLPGIVNAVFNQHNITLVLMENGTTAMTGHQDHPATGHNFNEVIEKIPVRSVLEGLGVQHIYEVDTYQQEKLMDLVSKAVEDDGFSVVIARHPCMLKFTREQRREKGYQARRVAIDQGTCDRNYECVAAFACPTFTRNNDKSVEINADLCIGDGSCIQTCPTSAISPFKAKK